MREKNFKVNHQIPIELMRIEAFGKLWAFYKASGDEMVFKVVPNSKFYQGSGSLIKAYRRLHKWTQSKAGKEFGKWQQEMDVLAKIKQKKKYGFSQAVIAKFETGERPVPGWLVLYIERLNRGMRVEDIQNLFLYHKKLNGEKDNPLSSS